jgi:hypothetical protein
MSSVNDLPHKLALDFFADPHTPVAQNALRHIDVNVWVRIVKQLAVVATIKVCPGQTVRGCKLMKIFFRKQTILVRRMILGKHAQQHHAFMLERGRVRRDHHSVRKKSIAGGQWVRTVLNFHKTHAATANRF